MDSGGKKGSTADSAASTGDSAASTGDSAVSTGDSAGYGQLVDEFQERLDGFQG